MMFFNGRRNFYFLKTGLVFILPVFLLTACSFNKDNVQDSLAGVDQILYEQKIGVLKPLDTKDLPQGTHMLVAQDNEVTLLSSKFFDLNSEKYLYKKVEVRGPFVPDEKNNHNLLEVEQITVLDEALVGLDSNNSWKDYEDSQFGFKIQHKGFVQAQKQLTGIDFVPVLELKANQSTYSQLITVRLFNNEKKLILAKWLEEIQSILPANQIPSEVTEMRLPAIKVINSSNTVVSLYIARDNLVYQLSHQGNKPENMADYRNLFYEMLYSFAFIQPATPVTLPTETSPVAPTSITKPVKETSDKTKESDVTKEETAVLPPENLTEESVPATSKAPTATSNTEIKASSVSDTYQKVTAYIQANLQVMAPEPSTSGNWKVIRFEFAEPNYVYTEYTNGTERRKLLDQYTLTNDAINLTMIGYFKTGTDKDWETVSGSNPGAGKAREVVAVSNDGTVAKQTTVKAGYRYLESSPSKFKIQYPANWYYSGGGGHYAFTASSEDGAPTLVGLEIVPQAVSSFSGNTIAVEGKNAVLVEENGQVIIYVAKSDGKTYKLTGALDYQNVLLEMAGSIED